MNFRRDMPLPLLRQGQIHSARCASADLKRNSIGEYLQSAPRPHSLTIMEIRPILAAQLEIFRIISEGTSFQRCALLHIEGGRSSAHPRTRYLRATSMIFSTKVANAMQSIATLITVRVSIGITS